MAIKGCYTTLSSGPAILSDTRLLVVQDSKSGSVGRGEPAQERLWNCTLGRRVLLALLTAILALGGTLALYWEAVQLPFLFDDMIHLRWLDWHSLPSIWTTAEGLGYYRPLTMSVWKIGHLLLGYNDPATLHTLNLLLHALNSVLAGYVAWRAQPGRGRTFYTLLATSLFVSFPFSYQAIPSTSSLSKPLIATLTMGSALLYWEARRRHSRRLLGFSLVAALLAPFAYESGVMVPLAILAVEIMGYSRREFERPSWLPILYMLLVWGGTLPVIISMEPETGASLSLPSLPSLWQNGVYFVEGLLSPITPVGTPLERILPVDRYVLLSVLDVLGLGALFAFYRWVKQTRLFLYALSWFVVAVLPLWLMLDFSYVITSPRLLYLGAVGSGLLWAGLPVFLWTKLPNRWWPKVLAVVSVVGLLSFNAAYVRQKMTLAGAVAAPLWQAAHAAKGQEHSSSLLYLNVPAWIAPKEPTYRIGTEGLTFIPEYVRVQDFVYVTTGAEPKIRAFMFDPAKQDWKAYIGYSGTGLDWDGLANEIRHADGVYLTTYSPDELRFVKAGTLDHTDRLPDSHTALARFGDYFLLLDSQIESSDGELVLQFGWYCQQVPDEDLTVFVHVYEQSGQLVAQGDGYPLLGLFPPLGWQPGDLVRDIRYIALPDDVADERYMVAVGWYDTATGQRLAAFDRQGQPAAQDAIQVPGP